MRMAKQMQLLAAMLLCAVLLAGCENAQEAEPVDIGLHCAGGVSGDICLFDGGDHGKGRG